MRIAILLLLALAAAGVFWLVMFDATPLDPARDEASTTEATVGSPEPDPAEAVDVTGPDRARAEALPTIDADEPVVGSCVVQGTVRHAGGGPAVRAYVWAPVGERSADAESGDGGRYELSLPTGRFDVLARTAGTGTARATVEVPPGATRIDGPTLTLDRGAQIVGRVFEDDGTPIESFRVRCAAEDGSALEFFTDSGTHMRFGSDDVLTDANGTFVLKGLAEGVPHTVWADASLRPDLIVDHDQLEGIIPGSGSVQFIVKASRAIEGRVVDADTNEPLRWFTISGQRLEDEKGHFETTVSRGPVKFEALGFDPLVRKDLDLKEGESRRGLVVKLRKKDGTGAVAVTVVDDGGRPLDSFEVRTPLGTFPSWSRKFDERKDGLATIKGLTGPTTLAASAAGHADAEFSVEIIAGETSERTVTLARGAAVRLRVLSADGGPFEGDVAVADTTGAGPKWRFAYAKPRGTLIRVTEVHVPAGEAPSRASLSTAEGRILALPAGRYVLSVYYEQQPKPVPFEVFAETEVDLIVRP